MPKKGACAPEASPSRCAACTGVAEYAPSHEQAMAPQQVTLSCSLGAVLEEGACARAGKPISLHGTYGREYAAGRGAYLAVREFLRAEHAGKIVGKEIVLHACPCPALLARCAPSACPLMPQEGRCASCPPCTSALFCCSAHRNYDKHASAGLLLECAAATGCQRSSAFHRA